MISADSQQISSKQGSIWQEPHAATVFSGLSILNQGGCLQRFSSIPRWLYDLPNCQGTPAPVNPAPVYVIHQAPPPQAAPSPDYYSPLPHDSGSHPRYHDRHSPRDRREYRDRDIDYRGSAQNRYDQQGPRRPSSPDRGRTSRGRDHFRTNRRKREHMHQSHSPARRTGKRGHTKGTKKAQGPQRAVKTAELTQEKPVTKAVETPQATELPPKTTGENIKPSTAQELPVKESRPQYGHLDARSDHKIHTLLLALDDPILDKQDVIRWFTEHLHTTYGCVHFQVQPGPRRHLFTVNFLKFREMRRVLGEGVFSYQGSYAYVQQWEPESGPLGRCFPLHIRLDPGQPTPGTDLLRFFAPLGELVDFNKEEDRFTVEISIATALPTHLHDPQGHKVRLHYLNIPTTWGDLTPDFVSGWRFLGHDSTRQPPGLHRQSEHATIPMDNKENTHPQQAELAQYLQTCFKQWTKDEASRRRRKHQSHAKEASLQGRDRDDPDYPSTEDSSKDSDPELSQLPHTTRLAESPPAMAPPKSLAPSRYDALRLNLDFLNKGMAADNPQKPHNTPRTTYRHPWGEAFGSQHTQSLQIVLPNRDFPPSANED
ncbi:hypothetical protein SELMODRAFT_430073 [Selaginella moellendorffii]|uniref:Uncharacterized protein n=1 Tax=Selaginella moellendorffii TaxID=88036 RepID=D8T888_SELML|nr:hypothetical protein SELMODRAFT_432264 [Selaginella moellendorffii]EFJ07096.1 hypothetical protein SELMODRAFT_430073 [Selaginella moellendorffii]